MNAALFHSANRTLGELGIDAEQEAVYRILLRLGAATADEVGQALGLPVRDVEHVLDSVASNGLATQSREQPQRFIATAPDIAIEALIEQRQERLKRVRASIVLLKQEAAGGWKAAGQEQLVELIEGRAAIARIFAQLIQAAQNEVVTLQRAPLLVSSLEPGGDARGSAVDAALGKSVRIRAIADAEFLALPGAVARLRHDVDAGEEVRVFPVLPFKMVIFDRRIGLVPLDLREPEGPSLLVRSSSLLDALYGLFEILWERSTPIAFTGETQHTGVGNASLPPIAKDLLPLLAAGLNDKAIAQELDLSPATLARRIAELMKALDSRTRFQMGWMAALSAMRQQPHVCADCDAPAASQASEGCAKSSRAR